MDSSAAARNTAVTVGRFAPSPSGRMHVGNAFASLMAWLAARAEGGRMVLRIEDLDDRCRDRAVAETLIDDLAWMGLSWDEGPYWQSAREDVYADAFERLDEQEQRLGVELRITALRIEVTRTDRGERAGIPDPAVFHGPEGSEHL